jgi:hypothetical protein
MNVLPTFDLTTTPECIITGCSLFSPDLGNAHLNGDLFQLGDVYIFNANPQLVGPHDFAYVKAVTVSTYFARRHIYVFHKTAAELNEAAKEYIA